MGYKKFRIKNYKAISDLEIDLGRHEKFKLIPIIGLNGSGKSTILEAISAFDYTNDFDPNTKEKKPYVKYENIVSIYNDIENDSEIKNKKIEISAIIEHLDKNLLKNMVKNRFDNLMKSNIAPEDVTRLMPIFRTHFENWYNTVLLNPLSEKPTIGIKRIFEKIETKYVIDNELDGVEKIRLVTFDVKKEKLSYFTLRVEEIEKIICEEIIKLSEDIVYIEHFNSEIPSNINVEDLKWFNIVSDIFEQSGKNINAFLDNKNDNKKSNELRLINMKLNSFICKYWNAEYNGKVIDINLDYKNDNFILTIKDLRKKMIFSDENKSSLEEDLENFELKFKIEERSKGLKWFLNFCFELYYNSNLKKRKNKERIILLDEPGVHIHSNFLKNIIEIIKITSEKNILVYATHLVELINPNIVPIKKVKIAYRESETIKLTNVDFSKDVKYKGAITPVFNALKIENFPLDFYNAKVVLTEGMSEFIFFKLLKEIKLFNKEVIVVPGHGASSLRDLISMIIGLSAEYTIILDSDEAGKNACKQYESIFGHVESKKWISQTLGAKTNNVELEDLYTEKMKELILEKSSYKGSGFSYKTGFMNFYYEAGDDLKDEFVKEIKESKEIKEFINIINKKLDIIN